MGIFDSWFLKGTIEFEIGTDDMIIHEVYSIVEKYGFKDIKIIKKDRQRTYIFMEEDESFSYDACAMKKELKKYKDAIHSAYVNDYGLVPAEGSDNYLYMEKGYDEEEEDDEE